MDIAARAKNIVLAPNAEWPVIAAESTSVGALYREYIMPMSAIPPICGVIGATIFLGRFGFGFGILGAVVSWALGLVGIYVVALIAQWLSAKFDGSSDIIAALKLVAYAHTASWVGGIFLLIPFLGILTALMGLYGLYLLYTGVAPVMGIPRGRAVTFTAALILSVIVVFLLIGFILRVLLGFGMMGMMM
jgi:hypothetical protein